MERDHAPVSAHRGREALAVGLRPCAVDADPYRRAGLAIAGEHVTGVIGVAWDEFVASE
jgi:hypothetical protein